MNGEQINYCWQRAVEPARVEAAKLRDGDSASPLRLVGHIEVLRALIVFLDDVFGAGEERLAEFSRELELFGRVVVECEHGKGGAR